MKKYLILLFAGLAILGGAALVYTNCCAKPDNKSLSPVAPPPAILPPSPEVAPPASPQPKTPGIQTITTPPAEVTFSGTILAGSLAKVIDFNQTDFDQAVAKKKLVLLYFYANWCPICRAEVPRMYEAFNQLSTGDVVAFRVNYNDDETDSDEEKLAKAHGVAYQHTKVFLKNGQRVLKTPESWDKERYLSEINSALQ